MISKVLREEARKWKIWMLCAILGVSICLFLIKFVHTEPVNVWGQALAVFLGGFIGIWICSFIEFIIVVVKNQRQKKTQGFGERMG